MSLSLTPLLFNYMPLNTRKATFSEELDDEDIGKYTEEFKRLSQPFFGGDVHDRVWYEIISKARGKTSRARLDHVISPSEKILLSLYGKYGIPINYGRINYHIDNRHLEHLDVRSAMMDLNRFTTRESVREHQDVRSVLSRDHRFEISGDNPVYPHTPPGSLHISIVVGLNHVILENSHLFPNDETGDFLYRISGVKRKVYGNDERSPSSREWPQTIRVNDIVSSQLFLSTSVSAEATVFRYSRFSKNASVTHKTYDHIGEEEIFYIIENNRYLKSIDISGYKMERHYTNPRERELKRDNRTSGEMLIPTGVKFQVMGIQKDVSAIERRVVALRPLPYAPPDANVRDMYNGRIFPKEFTPVDVGIP